MSKKSKKIKQRKLIGKQLLIGTLCIFMVAVMILPYIVSVLKV